MSFKPFEERLKEGLTASAIIGQLFKRMQQIEEAFIIAIPPPSVRGLGNAGGFRLQVQERTGSEVKRVLAATQDLMGRASSRAASGIGPTGPGRRGGSGREEERWR